MKTYKLTAGADTLKGTGADDKFEGLIGGDSIPKPKLNSGDKLYGGAGFDRLQATIGTEPTVPLMKSIEAGAFYMLGEIANLDLRRATAMESIAFRGSSNDGVKHVSVAGAAAVRKIQIEAGTDDTYIIDGLSSQHGSLKLAAAGNSLDVTLNALSGTAFKSLVLALGGGDFSLSGSALAASQLRIYADGAANFLTLGEDFGTAIRQVTIGGVENMTLEAEAGQLSNLTRFDAAAMKGMARATIGGSDLDTVLGGDGDDFLSLLSLGGDDEAPARIELGRGHDVVKLAFAFDAATQYFDGGAGLDQLEFAGAAENLSAAAKNFEWLMIDDATGLYDLTGTGIRLVELDGVATPVTLHGIANNGWVEFTETSETETAVTVSGSEGSVADRMYLSLRYGITLGAQAGGFSAEHLSNLTIEIDPTDTVLYLSTLGNDGDVATVEVEGGGRLTIRGTEGMATNIGSLSAIGGTRIDLGSLVGYSGAFVLTGATIIGGTDDDVIVGGIGGDVIDTGGGDNTVLGSLGADGVTLGAGDDTLIFAASSQSSNDLSHDTVHGFDTDEDTIDLAGMANEVRFSGTVASFSEGKAMLSAGTSVAFFNSADNSLYVDTNVDGTIDSSDMRIVLDGVAALTSENLEL